MAARVNLDVPPHAWLEGIVRDITEYCLGVPPGTVMVELLNDTEFLVFQRHWSKGNGMTWDQSILYIRQMHGVTHWAGMEVHIAARQCTINESWKDLDNNQEYQHQCAMEQMSNAQNQLQALAANKARRKLLRDPESQGWGHARRTNQYFAKEYLKQMDTPFLLAWPQSPEPDQFESVRKNCEDESTPTDTDMDDSGETGTTTRMETNHMIQSRDTD